MHVGQIITSDCANGLGIRIAVFVSGCTIHCKGCFNAQTWDFHYGEEYDEKMENFIIEELKKPHYAGITILGGEPFEPSNQECIIGLIRRVKAECPDRNIWMYTGFDYDVDLQPGGKRYTQYTDEILDSLEILVDGHFEESLRDLRLKFRGSSNQRIIRMKETRAKKEIVLSELNNIVE